MNAAVNSCRIIAAFEPGSRKEPAAARPSLGRAPDDNKRDWPGGQLSVAAPGKLLLDHIVAGKRRDLRQHRQKRIAIVRADARDNARVMLFLQALQLFHQPTAGVR